MKKIIVGILSFVLLFSAQSIFAAGSVTWNQDPNDCKSLSIVNATTLQGYTNPCWPLTTVSANAGELISIRIYYHNTGTVTATNTHVVLTPSTSLGNSSTSKLFTGRIISDQGSISISQSVRANLSSSQSLTLSSVEWYTNNTAETLTPLLGSQSSVLTSSGLPIGNITASGSSQGSVVVSFRVSNNGTLSSGCSISNFTASNTSITSGDSSTLNWNTNNCKQVSIAPNIGNVNASGSRSVSPTNTTTYTLTASGSDGRVQTKNVTISVKQPSVCAINSFTANPTSITSGGSSVLSWNTTNCTNVTISNLGYNVPTSGNQAVYPTNTTTYTLTAYGSNGGTETRSATVIVNQQPSSCAINSFTANPTSIASGQSSTLNWSTSNCTSVSISPIVGNVNTSDSQLVYPTQTTTYTLTAFGLDKIIRTRNVTVYVNQAPQETCTINNFSANPTSIVMGESSTLNWSTSNCTDAVISNLAYNIPTSGTQTVYPTQTVTYTITAHGSSGSAQPRSVTIYVNQQPSTCIINNFSASPTSITSGNSSTLNWSTNNCTSVDILYIGSVNNSGSRSVHPTNTTTYTLTAYSSSGVIQTRSATVYVDQPSVCEINSFYASPDNIEKGDASILNWNTTNCTNVTISNLGYNVPTSGNQAVYPTNTKTYTLTAYSSMGISQSRSVTVYVDEEENDDNNCSIDSFTASDTSIEDGDYTTLRWNTTDCEDVRISSIGDVSNDGSERVYPSHDTTYTLTAYDEDGDTETESIRIYVDDENNNDDECYINSFTTNKIYINSGDAVTLRWSTTDCDDVDISGVDNNLDEDGSEVVYPNSSRTYTLRASGDYGSDSRSITINVNYTPIIPIYNTNVVTTVATNISQTSAQLNGLITSGDYTNANVYFEYGKTVNLGMRTNSRTTNGNTNFSEYVSGLSANTIYYFQAVSEGSNGISRGAIQVFKTLGYINPVTPVKPVVIQGTTVVASASPIMLRIENRYQTIGIGDIIDYTVYYKNISNSKLTNPMVQVFIPEGITLINISSGTYSESDRTLSVPIADLNPSDEGVIYLQGRVDDMNTNLAQIVTTAILIYTNPNGAQENAMAYVLNNPKVVNLLGASAFFGNIFGMGLIGWLLLIIFIMLLILIARSFYNRRSDTIIHNHTN